MSEEEIEKLAFKNRKTLANLNEIDLLEIIEFLQLDRKQWINQYTKAHNDYVDLQQENQQLKKQLEKASKVCLADHKYASSKEDEVITLQHENQQLKEEITLLKASEPMLELTKYYNERDLYKSVIDEVRKFINEYIKEDYYEKLDEYITHFTWNMTKDDLEKILNKANFEESE